MRGPYGLTERLLAGVRSLDRSTEGSSSPRAYSGLRLPTSPRQAVVAYVFWLRRQKLIAHADVQRLAEAGYPEVTAE